MSLVEDISSLCERTTLSFWDEPLNALSNIAFIIAGWFIYRYYRNHEDLHGKWIWDIHLLTLLTFMVGFGSFVFHTIPSDNTEIADIIFIVLFINIYFSSAVMRITRRSAPELIVYLVAFWGGTHLLTSLFPSNIADSVGYLSSMITLLGIALYLQINGRPSARVFLSAACLGMLALLFRNLDDVICDAFPIGTHFLWHSLNAGVVYLLMIQLVRNVDRKARLKRLKRERKERKRLRKMKDV